MTLTYFKVHIPEEVGQCKMGSLRKKETAFVIMISFNKAGSKLWNGLETKISREILKFNCFCMKIISSCPHIIQGYLRL